MGRDAWDIHEQIEGKAEQIETIKIRRNPKYLCFRCKGGHVYKTEGANSHKVYCKAIEREMPDTIVECTSFQATGTLGVLDLARLAKIIDIADPKKAGFKKGQNE